MTDNATLSTGATGATGVAPVMRIDTESRRWARVICMRGETGPTGPAGSQGAVLAAAAPTGDANVWLNTGAEAYTFRNGAGVHPFPNPFYVKVGSAVRRCEITGSAAGGFTLSIT